MAKGEVSRDYLYSVSPARNAEDFRAPVLLIHGEDDKIVSINQSKTMYKKLKRAEKPVEFIKLDGENHYLMEGETRLQAVEAMVSFVDKHLNP